MKWVASLGSQSYATPIVAGGRVLIGTNNVGFQPPPPGTEDALIADTYSDAAAL